MNKVLVSMGVREYQIENDDNFYPSTISFRMHREEFENVLSILHFVYLKDKYPALQNEWNRYINLCKIAE